MRNAASQTLFIKKSRKMHNLLARYLDRVSPRCSLVLFYVYNGIPNTIFFKLSNILMKYTEWYTYIKLSTNHESLSQPIMKIGY